VDGVCWRALSTGKLCVLGLETQCVKPGHELAAGDVGKVSWGPGATATRHRADGGEVELDATSFTVNPFPLPLACGEASEPVRKRRGGRLEDAERWFQEDAELNRAREQASVATQAGSWGRGLQEGTKPPTRSHGQLPTWDGRPGLRGDS